MHLLGRGVILQQLKHAITKDDTTFGGCYILPQHEGFRISQRDQKLALICLDISNQIFQTLHQTGTLGLKGPFQCVRISGQEIGWGHQINYLFYEITQTRMIIFL